MTFKPEDIDFVDIFPPIGIARVGGRLRPKSPQVLCLTIYLTDSDEWYVGPEVPGVGPIPDGGFKDSQHRIKKQASFVIVASNLGTLLMNASLGCALPCVCIR